MSQRDEDVTDEVEWFVDDQGRDYFLEDGVKFVLHEDGYAYPEDQLPGPDAGFEQTADEAADRASERPDDTQVIERPTATATADSTTTTRLQVHEDTKPQAGSPAADDTLLQLSGLKSGYGSLPVLHGVTMDIRRGETAVLLGLNGAGKTTTALNIAGALKAWDGSVTFDGQEIAGWGTRKCVNAGIVMVPEGRRVFPDLTVARNLQIGAWSQRKDSDYVEQQLEAVFEYFPRLRERTHQLAGTLSGGEQQMLAVGRGLMARPRLLIIDEASMGLAPVIVQDVFDIVSQINENGVTVLMIEQNVGALDVADVGIVMEQGRIVTELRGEELRDRSKVSELLMG